MLIAISAVAVIIAVVVFLRNPPARVRQVRIGDSPRRVHELLGPPQTIFASDAELRQSDLVPMSFVFEDIRNTMSDVPASRLPVVIAAPSGFQ